MSSFRLLLGSLWMGFRGMVCKPLCNVILRGSPTKKLSNVVDHLNLQLGEVQCKLRWIGLISVGDHHMCHLLCY